MNIPLTKIDVLDEDIQCTTGVLKSGWNQFGMPCDLKALAAIAKKHGVELAEDAARAIGSFYADEPIGNCRHSRIACLSFHPHP